LVYYCERRGRTYKPVEKKEKKYKPLACGGKKGGAGVHKATKRSEGFSSLIIQPPSKRWEKERGGDESTLLFWAQGEEIIALLRLVPLWGAEQPQKVARVGSSSI